VLCHAAPVSALVPAREGPPFPIEAASSRLRNPNARSMWAVPKNPPVMSGLFGVTKMPRI